MLFAGPRLIHASRAGTLFSPGHTAVMKRTARGFSLPEIMVILIIVSTLSTGGIVGFQRWQQHQQLWQTTHRLSQFLHQLRSDANTYNRDHLLVFYPQPGGGCLASHTQADRPCDGRSPWQFIPGGKGISVGEITPGLGFYGLMNTARPGHITVHNPAGIRKVIVSAWGRIRHCAVEQGEQCS